MSRSHVCAAADYVRSISIHPTQYLRASTKEQDASRAHPQLEAFAAERDLPIVATYVENESGATLKRPELFRLLADCRPGDILLTEQVDSLPRPCDEGPIFSS